MKQLKLNIYQGRHGGRRPGSGRKRIHSPGVAHRTRDKVNLKTALHVNFKLKTLIRNKACLKHLQKAIQNARSHGLRVLHFSLQSNHVHFILEAKDNETLTKGMRSLTITFAKGIGKGRVQLERYHLHVLRSVRETRNAVHYVVFNQQKHTGLKRAYVDSYSSLGMIKDLRVLAKSAKILIIFRKIHEFPLDQPLGWCLRKILSDSFP